MALIFSNCSDMFEPNIEVGKFPDGNSHVKILNMEEGQENLSVFCRLYPDQNDAWAELSMLLWKIKQAGKSTTLFVPFVPYARHDKAVVEGEVVAADWFCSQLATQGVKKLITFDCHFLNEEGEFERQGLKIQNISLGKMLIEKAREILGEKDLLVIGPDQGAAYLAKQGGGRNFTKTRKEYVGGKVGYRHIETMSMDFNVEGRAVLLLDDMISTGSTMLEALGKILDAGAKKIACAATHGLFLFDCYDRLKKRSDAVFSSDTILSPYAKVKCKEGCRI